MKDFDDSMTVLFNGINQLAAKGYDIDALDKAMRGLSKRKKVINNIEIITEVAKEYSVPTEALLDYLLIYAEYFNRSIINNILRIPDYKDWDGVRPLDSLFQTEILPRNPKKYFDQEFINYLQENNVDLEKIHWRNFERLVSEFFNSNFYYVNLGPGRNDGGVDIRVWSDKNSAEGPPLILIQCKRYREQNEVSIETIKAFYADVIHEDAGIGLVATTSTVAIGGKKIINSRGYKMTIAESNEIKKMVYDMWRKFW